MPEVRRWVRIVGDDWPAATWRIEDAETGELLPATAATIRIWPNEGPEVTAEILATEGTTEAVVERANIRAYATTVVRCAQCRATWNPERERRLEAGTPTYPAVGPDQMEALEALADVLGLPADGRYGIARAAWTVLRRFGWVETTAGGMQQPNWRGEPEAGGACGG